MSKVSILVLSVLLVASVAAFSLDVNLGVKAGAGVGYFTGEGWNDYLDTLTSGDSGASIAFGAAVFADFKLLDFLAIQPGVAYMRTGASYSFTDALAQDVQTDVAVNLLTIPLYIRPMFPVGAGDVYLFAGPAFTLVLGDVTETADIGGTDTDTDFTPGTDSFWGVSGGLGYSFPLGPGFALAEAKYTMHFNDALEYGAVDANSSTALFQLGYMIPIFQSLE
jgi:hypothetical protein